MDRGLGQFPLPVPTQEGPQWLHMRDFDRLLRESQREVLRLQRQIALRNQQDPPPPPGPSGPTARVRAGASAPGIPREVSTRTRAGVCRCGWGRLQDLPLKGARSPEGPVVACELQGLGSFPDPRGRVPAQAPSFSTCAVPVPGGSGSALRRSAPRGARPIAPAALPVVQPGSKSLVALAAALGPAVAAASRSRRSSGTPPSASCWSARPGPRYRGAPGTGDPHWAPGLDSSCREG